MNDRPDHKKLRLREVALAAGVSTATVSRVLNDVPNVRPEYRERVLEAVRDLGYRPNRLARNLRHQKAEMIGVIVSDIENPHFSQMVRTIEDVAFQSGFRLLLCNSDETAEKQRAYLDVMADERVLGVIMAPSEADSPQIGRVLDLGIPIVALDREVTDPRADTVVVDNFGGVRRGVEHLIADGHTRIGFVGGRPEIATGAERLAGYERAMREAGLIPRTLPGHFRIEGGRRAAEELLDSGELTALVIANNLMAVGALEAVRSRGLRVPDDVAIVAVDDPFWAELISPPLTTLAQPVREIADRAIRMLLGRVRGEREEPERAVFEFELRVRQSCGCGGRSHPEPAARR